MINEFKHECDKFDKVVDSEIVGSQQYNTQRVRFVAVGQVLKHLQSLHKKGYEVALEQQLRSMGEAEICRLMELLKKTADAVNKRIDDFEHTPKQKQDAPIDPHFPR